MAVNGIYVVLGEANALIALLKKARRYWHSHQGQAVLEDTDPLLRSLADLKDVLNNVSALADVAPQAFLSPFLEIIRSQNTNGPITEAALAAVARFLNYGVIDAESIKSAQAVESIAQAVTHTKFIGGANAGSDECVLFKILQVLRSLLLSPVGSLLSNEAVCDMMQSCFRICFEQNLSEMLRKAAESTLSDMTQLIFARLPSFEEDIRHPYIRKLVMSAKGKRRRGRQKRSKMEVKQNNSEDEVDAEVTEINEGKQLLDEEDDSVRSRTSSQHMVDLHATGMGYAVVLNTDETIDVATRCDENLPSCEGSRTEANEGEVLNSVEVDEKIPMIPALRRERHPSLQLSPTDGSAGALQMPYGLPCARELLRFLITLTNPLDRHNTEQMIVLGLNLLIVVLEASADHLSNYSLFLPLIKDELCRSLLQLLETEKLPILASTSRASFLLFESCRMHLKFQLEAYFNKLRAIVVSEQTSISYEKKEIALDSIVQLWRIPGLVTELYLNYDCDLYCSNIFEDLTKLLVENAFPLHGLQSTSLLSLEALLVVIDNIEQNCVYRNAGTLPPSGIDCKQPVLQRPILSGMESAQRQTNPGETGVDMELLTKLASLRKFNRHANISSQLSMSKILEQKKRKRIIAEGTEVFNQSPKKGIEFLREKGLLGADPESMVEWLRENPRLDKKMIADYICSRKHADVLEAFVKSFSFEETRLDVALRMFLETFRLPGEAAEISMVMQHFSDHWYRVNNEPFNHPDAAFTLSYAIIMLNTDQHNPQVRRNQPPMTVDCFKRNLSGTNGKADFDSQMLEDVYAAIKNDEIVMPAEQTGIVKENYMWKVLLRRGETSEGNFTHAPIGWNDHDLFAIAWGPAIAAFSYVYDKSQNDIILQKALNGYRKCASIAAHYGMSDVFDNLIIHLCKFSTLMPKSEGVGEEPIEIQRQRSVGSDPQLQDTPETIAIRFGENQKAHLAARAFFELVHNHGDILREGWKNVIECLIQLFRARLLPPELTEVEDFVDPKGWVSITRIHHKQMPISRSEPGLLSWFGLGGGSNEYQGLKRPTPDQENAIKIAQQVINDCHPVQLVGDSKYLTTSSLFELLSAISQASQAIVEHTDSATQNPARIQPLSLLDEDALVYHLEMMVNITQENKDRIAMVWPVMRRHIDWLLSKRFGKNPLLVERAVVGLLRVVNRNLFRGAENTTKEMLQSLTLILTLPEQAIFILSKQIAYGLHALIQNNAANLHNKDDWNILFSLLEAAGAAVLPDDMFSETRVGIPERKAHSDGGELPLLREKVIPIPVITQSGEQMLGNEDRMGTDRGYASEGGATRTKNAPTTSLTTGSDSARSSTQNVHEWIHLDHKDAARATEDALRAVLAPRNAYNHSFLVLRTNLGRHEPAAFLKSCETLSFLLRDAMHVTPDNFESCVHCLRTFIEASLDGGRYAAGPLSGDAQNQLHSNSSGRRNERFTHQKEKEMSTEVDPEQKSPKEEEKQFSSSYAQCSHLLLDLCHQLHDSAPTIYQKWAQEGLVDASTATIWPTIWKPLLQAMARLGCDCRRQIRAAAINYLVRALLIADLQAMSAVEWDSCFRELLEAFSPMDPLGMEETRVRAMQLVTKTLLNHLNSLAILPSFPQLWLRLLDYLEKYLRLERSELLSEAVPESLKNMLLVFQSQGLFSSIPDLYQITIDRMGPVLPQLIQETMSHPPNPSVPQSPPTASLARPLPTNMQSSGRTIILAPTPPATEQQ